MNTPTKTPQSYLTHTLLSLLGLSLMTTTLLGQESGPKLFEPYKPKPSGSAPDGWEIKILEGSSVDSTTVLKNGKEVKVSAPAYELVPKEGALTFRDPGFQPELANAQKYTIGALLTQYSEKASDLQESLDRVVSELEANLRLSNKTAAETTAALDEKKQEVEKKADTEEKKPIKKK